MDKAIYEPILLHPEQISGQKIWERQEGESAKWYWRFRNYLTVGPNRSINAVFEAEQQQKAAKSRARPGETWYSAAKKYQWVQRADAWDNEQDEQKAAIMRQIAIKCSFVSRPYRIVALNGIAETLARQLEQGQDAVTFLALTKQMQLLILDITKEVEAWDVQIDASCDAAALDTLKQKQGRMNDLQLEREEEQEYQLERQMELLKKQGLI